jgi:hypothetical protein
MTLFILNKTYNMRYKFTTVHTLLLNVQVNVGLNIDL